MLPSRLRAGICWFFAFVLLPYLARAGPKARLQPRTDDINMLLMSDKHCQRITRFTATEIEQLARDLLISPDAPIKSNWRFAPLHRLLLALVWLSNAAPSRKHSLNVGWASNAVLNNARYHIEAIIQNLGAAGSRQ